MKSIVLFRPKKEKTTRENNIAALTYISPLKLAAQWLDSGEAWSCLALRFSFGFAAVAAFAAAGPSGSHIIEGDQREV